MVFLIKGFIQVSFKENETRKIDESKFDCNKKFLKRSKNEE